MLSRSQPMNIHPTNNPATENPHFLYRVI